MKYLPGVMKRAGAGGGGGVKHRIRSSRSSRSRARLRWMAITMGKKEAWSGLGGSCNG